MNQRLKSISVIAFLLSLSLPVSGKPMIITGIDAETLYEEMTVDAELFEEDTYQNEIKESDSMICWKRTRYADSSVTYLCRLMNGFAPGPDQTPKKPGGQTQPKKNKKKCLPEDYPSPACPIVN